jgi:hypothetical protein
MSSFERTGLSGVPVKDVVENITGLTACCKMGLEEEQGINNLSLSWDGA